VSVTVKELQLGDVFRVIGETKVWRKTGPNRVTQVGALTRGEALYPYAATKIFTGKKLELIEKADTSEIRRMDDTLILRGGEVTLRFTGAWQVLQCNPDNAFTEFVLTSTTFSGSEPEEGKMSADTAFAFSIKSGGKHLGRPGGTDVFAYQGRVYGRATNKEVLGKSKYGGYKVLRKVDDVKRMVIAGVLTIPGEFALYDIMMEHFGPDAKPSE
jgi:hypothetical protein